ncbi:MAG: hypothetical protein D6689_02715 [Deltaproteobacteria bacterium]|nr:MAG: hypothetical protein D6689_02715 [Deltaproteobacteria bacterium]
MGSQWNSTPVWLAAVALALAPACSKDRDAATDQGRRGLPPASQVKPPEPALGQVAAPAARDPHAGMDTANPHAGMGTANPHAGMGMANPHAGMGSGPVDPNQFLKGTIDATDATRSAIKPGDVIYLMVKPINPVTGEVIGNTMAVDRIEVTSLPLEFSLTGANVMMPGTKFEGDVVVIARVDRDGEARSRNPGDIEGKVRAKIPAAGLKLALDTVVR